MSFLSDSSLHMCCDGFAWLYTAQEVNEEIWRFSIANQALIGIVECPMEYSLFLVGHRMRRSITLI